MRLRSPPKPTTTLTAFVLVCAVPMGWATAESGPTTSTMSASPGHAASAVVAEIVRRVDAGENYAEPLRQATELGGDSILAAVEFLDEAKPARAAALHELIASVARSRGWHPELTRLYDPAGFQGFTGAAATDVQARIARCLTWTTWSASTPDALFRAAPDSTLAWLRAQAESAEPDTQRLASIWRAWGVWARVGRESESNLARLCEVASLSTHSDKIIRTPSTRAALAKFIGEVRCLTADAFLRDCLVDVNEPECAESAAAAAGRIASDHATPQAWRDLAVKALHASLERQTSPAVQRAVIAALEGWPATDTVGDALLAQWGRFNDPSVRRAVMYSAAPARWSARAKLIKAGLGDSDGSVVGAALQAVTQRPEPELRDDLHQLAASFKEANPYIIDALGASKDPSATLRLADWFRKEQNITLQIKIIAAMRNAASPESKRMLIEAVRSHPSPGVVEQAISAIEVIRAEEGIPLMLSLARDRGAPHGVRMQAIRGISAFDRPEVRATLRDLAHDIGAEFRAPPGPGAAPGEMSSVDRIELARVYLAVARLRLAEPAASTELGDVYRDGTATARFTTLILLASMSLEHPVIDEAIRSHDFAAVWAGLRAASANGAAKHADAIRFAASSPFMEHLRHSAVDTFHVDDLLSQVESELAGAKQP